MDIFVTSDEIYHFLRQKHDEKSTDISKSFRQKYERFQYFPYPHLCLFVFLVFFNYFFVCFCRIACIDAMIDQVDKNKDYKLDQTEFTDLLKPELVPFSKGMTLPFNNVKFLFSKVYL